MVETNFKQTEIGLIPEDWDIVNLESLGTFSKGKGIKKDESNSGDIPAIRYGELYTKHNDIIKKINSFISKEVALFSKVIKTGDILFAGSGETKSEIGKSAAYIDNASAYAGGDIIILTPSLLHSSVYLGYLLNNNLIQVQKATKAQGDAVVHIYASDLKTLKIPLPEPNEQQAIATALSDANAWVESIEKLIAKKRLIKQGAMQQLLTPKENWEVKKLRDVAEYRRGSFPQPYGLEMWYDDIKGMPFIQVYDVDKNRKLKPTTKRKISISAQQMSVFIATGSIVLTIQGSIGRIALTQYNAYVDRTLLIFERFKIPFDKFFFMITIEELFRIEGANAPGGTIKTITKEALSDFSIFFPELNEQIVIGKVLSDMDAEINKLELKLQKAQQIKQGMMQQLLTGKIRLVAANKTANYIEEVTAS